MNIVKENKTFCIIAGASLLLTLVTGTHWLFWMLLGAGAMWIAGNHICKE